MPKPPPRTIVTEVPASDGSTTVVTTDAQGLLIQAEGTSIDGIGHRLATETNVDTNASGFHFATTSMYYSENGKALITLKLIVSFNVSAKKVH